MGCQSIAEKTFKFSSLVLITILFVNADVLRAQPCQPAGSGSTRIEYFIQKGGTPSASNVKEAGVFCRDASNRVVLKPFAQGNNLQNDAHGFYTYNEDISGYGLYEKYLLHGSNDFVATDPTLNTKSKDVRHYRYSPGHFSWVIGWEDYWDFDFDDSIFSINAFFQCRDDIDNDGDGMIDMTDPGCSSREDNNEADGTTQCQDNIDNDRDGAIDHPSDFGCSSKQDNDEANPKAQCQDKQDNDRDGLIDTADPGCSSLQDNNESDGTSQCQDKIDNDQDGLVDDADPGCWSDPFRPQSYNPKLNDESNATAQCQDGVDNDGDGATDYPADFSCSARTDTCEELPLAQCQDGVDNDKDGMVDAADPGCRKDPTNPATYNSQDNDEYHLINVPACRDRSDNDLDGVTDRADPGCWTNPSDPQSYCAELDDESRATTQCQDKQDNDSDALVDCTDPGCWRDPQDPASYDRTLNNEAAATTQCQDKKDNDGDGLIDAADPGCWTIPSDPKSYRPRNNQEDDEIILAPQCQDKIDNDGDGLVDRADPGCWVDPEDPDSYDPDRDDESRGTTACQDGMDNDGDGAIDFPQDSDCSSRTDNNEGDDDNACGLSATVKIKSVITANNHSLAEIAAKNAKALRRQVRKLRDVPGLISPEPLERFYRSGLTNVKRTLAALDDLTQKLPEILNPCPGTQVCSSEVSNLEEKQLMQKNAARLTKLAKRITRRLWYYQQMENPLRPFAQRPAGQRRKMRQANKQDRRDASQFEANLLAAIAEVPDSSKICN